ncbi:hypothetical protein V2J09_008696 [Rumex salicifolius]
MRHLGLGSGGGGGAADAGGRESPYPELPCVPDCIYYVGTGFCRYGARCRFNHPHDRGAQANGNGGARAGKEDYPARPGQHVCQYYMRTGSCKFGSSCKYHHPRHEAGSTTALVTLNFHGYPLRPYCHHHLYLVLHVMQGEKECSYYMKTGLCKFSMTCKFHHPQLANVQIPEPIPPSIVYPTIPHPQQFMAPGSYVHGPYPPRVFPPGNVPYSGWPPYMASYSAVLAPSTQSTVRSVYAGPYPYMTSFAGPSSSIQKEITYHERHGQPECQHYLRTGECKYGSSCRYRHPAERSCQKPSSAATPVVLPLRPGVKYCVKFAFTPHMSLIAKGAPTCTRFVQHGVCKFGPTCKFNHPTDLLSYSPSSSPLPDTTVARTPRDIQ